MKKKILIYSDSYLFGGSEYIAVNILKNKYLQDLYSFFFAYRKHSVYAKSLDQLFTKEEQLNFYPLPILTNINLFLSVDKTTKNKWMRRVIKFPFFLLQVLGFYKLVNRILFTCLLWKLTPDLIHINNGGYPAATSCLDLALIASKMKIQVIMQVNNIAQVRTNEKEKRIDKKIERAVSNFVTASEYAKAMLSRNRGFSLNKIDTIHNAVEVVQANQNREQILSTLNLPKDKIILIEVALLQQRKGQISLLQALVKMRKMNPVLFADITLLLIGTGEDEHKIREYISDNDLGNSVYLLGYRFDYIDYVAAADIVLLPSIRDEDMPLIILSAMSLGKAIISTTVGGIPEEIENGISGILLNPNLEGDLFVDTLAKAIVETLENRLYLAMNAKEKFNKDFSVEKYTREIKKKYAEFCS